MKLKRFNRHQRIKSLHVIKIVFQFRLTVPKSRKVRKSLNKDLTNIKSLEASTCGIVMTDGENFFGHLFFTVPITKNDI